MKFFASIAVVSCLVGCASGDMSDHPANPEIQREIAQVVDAVRQETGTALYSDLRRLVAYDVFAVEQVSKLAEDPNARLRSNAMWVLAQIRDAERPKVVEHVNAILRKGLKDDDPTVRLEAAAGLAAKGSWDVLPVLIDGLEAQDSSIRYRCHEQLVSTTSKDFGYQVDAPDEDRKAAADRWRKWYDGWLHSRS
jgi:HEAT repeat protein